MINKKVIFSFLFVATLAVLPLQVYANLVDTSNPNVVSDDFHNGVKKQDLNKPWDEWYFILDSADAQGFLRMENIQNTIHSNNDVALRVQNNNGDKFLRMSLYPEQYPGTFNIVQGSDQRDGFTYNVAHRWLPTVGHPVTVTSRFRASDNYHTDGGGGAVGTFGVWLQNNPDELTEAAKQNPSRDDSFIDHHDNFFAFGFNWSDQYTLGGFFRGLKATLIDQSSLAPITVDVPTTVNINDWVTAKTVWSVNESGVQTITYYINDQQITQQTLAVPMPALSIVYWIDNEEPQFGPSGIIYQYANPVSDQNFDMDSISVTQE
jgi:hypothetical protein